MTREYMDAEEQAGYHNGAVWEQVWPSCLQIVLTYLVADNLWCLMSVPEKSRLGGYCMTPHSERSGRWMYKYDELRGRLQDWRYLSDLSLVPVQDLTLPR